RRERAHAALLVARARHVVDAEIEPAVVDAREELLARIDPVAAEHALRAHAAQRAELLDHELDERSVARAILLLHGHDRVPPDSRRLRSRHQLAISPTLATQARREAR